MDDCTISELPRLVERHRDERDWRQFHTPKELVVSLCVESAELLSIFQWKTGEELAQVAQAKREPIRDELADVFHSLLLLAAELQMPLETCLRDKLAKDALKYPVSMAKGKNVKYNEL